MSMLADWLSTEREREAVQSVTVIFVCHGGIRLTFQRVNKGFDKLVVNNKGFDKLVVSVGL